MRCIISTFHTMYSHILFLLLVSSHSSFHNFLQRFITFNISVNRSTLPLYRPKYFRSLTFLVISSVVIFSTQISFPFISKSKVENANNLRTSLNVTGRASAAYNAIQRQCKAYIVYISVFCFTEVLSLHGFTSSSFRSNLTTVCCPRWQFSLMMTMMVTITQTFVKCLKLTTRLKRPRRRVQLEFSQTATCHVSLLPYCHQR